jgi:hypothetical protein
MQLQTARNPARSRHRVPICGHGLDPVYERKVANPWCSRRIEPSMDLSEPRKHVKHFDFGFEGQQRGANLSGRDRLAHPGL